MQVGNKKARAKNGFFEVLRRSFFIYYLTHFSLIFYTAVRDSAFGRLFTSYDSLSDAFCSSYIVTKLRTAFSGNGITGIKKMKHRIAKTYEGSLLLSYSSRILHDMLFLYVNALGLFFFSFGFYIVVAQLLKQYTFHAGGRDSLSLIIGVVLMVLSLFMFFSKKTIAATVNESRLLRALLFDFLGLRTPDLSEAPEASRRTVNVPFLLAIVFGVLAIFIRPVYILAAAILLLLVAMVLASPEAGVISVFLFLPFLPTMALVALIALIFVSYFVKLLCGRRTVKFTLVDFAVLLCMFFTFFGGVFAVSPSGVPKMLVFICFMMGYFIVKNAVRSPSLVKKCLCSLAISGFAVSLYGLYQNFFGTLSTTWQDTAMFSEIRGRVISTFANPNVLGEYLILVLPITFALMMTAKKTNERFMLLLIAVADLACLVFTWSRGAWLGFAVAIVLFLCLADRRFFTAGIFCIPAVCVFFSFGSSFSIVRRFTTLGDSSTAYRLGIWKGTLLMLADIFFFGIGIGEGAFREIYPFYALSGIEKAPHSHSLFLQITVETGIAGIIAFLIFVFLFAQCSMTFARNAKNKANRLICLGIFSSVVAFLTQGLTDYVFYNYRLFLLFFMIAGLGIAHIFTAKSTTEESDSFYY